MIENKTRDIWRFLGGLFLIGLGILFLVGQFLRFDVWHYLWPLFIIGFGLLFFVGMVTGGKAAGGLAIPGSLFTMLGLILLYQNTFNHWASWAYIWSLLAPTSIGIGMMLFGRWSGHPDLARTGRMMTIIGLIIFVVLGGFFELLIGFAGVGSPGRILWPVLLILLGVFILLGRGFDWLKTTTPTPPAITPASPPAKTPEEAASTNETTPPSQA